MLHSADRTHVSEWTPSERETDCRQRLLPAEAECTSILRDRNSGRKKRGGKESEKEPVRVLCQQVFYSERVLFIGVSCLFSRDYLPSWVPIHTVPAVSPDITRPERLCQKERLRKQQGFPNVSSKSSVWNEGMKQGTEYIGQVDSRQPLQPVGLALTYGRHSTCAEGRSCRREAELIQYCVGPCWINHCNFTAEGRARNYPHWTLAEKDGYGVWKHEWHETMCPWAVLIIAGWHCTW